MRKVWWMEVRSSLGVIAGDKDQGMSSFGRGSGRAGCVICCMSGWIYKTNGLLVCYSFAIIIACGFFAIIVKWM